MKKPCVERVREVLAYDPDTGLFTRNGKLAGTVGPDGYVKICIDRVRTCGQILAWVIMIGEWPKETIDHENRIKHDNRWDNLRPASQSEQQYNVAMRSTNTSGLKGAFYHKGHNKWMSQIRIGGRPLFLGYFDTARQAHEAYDAKAKQLHGEFYCSD